MFIAIIVLCIATQANSSHLKHRWNKINFSSRVGSTSSSCICVPEHECDSETRKIITDGRGIAEFRSNDEDEDNGCNAGLECCELPEGFPEDDEEIVTNNGKKNVSPDPSPSAKSQQCGVPERLDVPKAQDVHFRISGPTDVITTDQGQIPWMLAVIYKMEMQGQEPLKQFFCGASLYTEQIAITAGHCVERFKPDELLIIAGEWDLVLSGEVEPPQERHVKEILIHPDYINRPLKNDIALIKVKTPFQFAFSVKPVCLSPPEFDITAAIGCYAAGWGVKDTAMERHEDAKLKRTRLPYVQHNKCEESLKQSSLGKLFSLHSSFLCFGGVRGVDTCKGDGGGPVTCEVMKGHTVVSYLVGITSWGVSCGERPAAYTNVPLFYNWIVEATKKLEELN